MSDRPDDLLHLYLDDHWAGAGAGASLAKRLHHNNRDTPWAGELAWLVEQIEADDDTLASLRRDVGADGGAVKRYGARIGERLARLKPNRRLHGYSPLSRLLEAEAMMTGVAAKQRLWASLRSGGAGRPQLASYDLPGLDERAGEQLAVLSALHEQAAAVAFDPATQTLRGPSSAHR
jgi:hypothetical protein